MSRRPADKMQRSSSMGHGQQAIWEAIRAHPESFTITELWGVIDMHRQSIKNYVHRLVKGGYVAQQDDFATSYAYRLVRDAGQHAPRVTPDGKDVIQGSANQNMWRAMRSLSQFSPLDIQAHANTEAIQVSLKTAKGYCAALLKAGYLRVMRKAEMGQRQAVYKLIRNTGPKAPQIQRVKQVFDPNLGQVAKPEMRS